MLPSITATLRKCKYAMRPGGEQIES